MRFSDYAMLMVVYAIVAILMFLAYMVGTYMLGSGSEGFVAFMVIFVTWIISWVVGMIVL